ncbi:MAG TPA: hypothetical protein GYA10_11035 [Alphaproteobacteria bacterium]|nr:hypothetical protein [Alphaproteobacteria bacterium]
MAALAVGGGLFQWTVGKHGNLPDTADTRAIPEEARELYRRGTWLWNRRTPDGIAGAIEVLTRALEIHPDYAEAHAGLAMAYNLARQYSGMSGWEAYPKAEAHARRAVALDAGYAFGQSVLAFVEFHWLWRVQAGLERFETARRLDPDSTDNLIWYASSLLHVARNEEALAMLTRAQELAPDNGTTHTMKALALLYGGRLREASTAVEELIRRNPDHPWNYAARSFIRLAERDYAGYLEDYARLGEKIAVPRYRAVAEAGLAALGAQGAEAMAQAMAAVDMVFFERGEALAWDIAGHYAMIGNGKEAMPWLNRSFDRHEERLIGLRMNVAFRPIRGEAQYRALLARIGLPTD